MSCPLCNVVPSRNAVPLQDLIREDLASLESGRHVLYKNALRAGAKVKRTARVPRVPEPFLSPLPGSAG